MLSTNWGRRNTLKACTWNNHRQDLPEYSRPNKSEARVALQKRLAKASQVIRPDGPLRESSVKRSTASRFVNTVARKSSPYALFYMFRNVFHNPNRVTVRHSKGKQTRDYKANEIDAIVRHY